MINRVLSFMENAQLIHRSPSLTRKVSNTTIAEFGNTVDPDETAHNEPSHLDLQCLPSIVFDFQHDTVIEILQTILSSAFLALYGLRLSHLNFSLFKFGFLKLIESLIF